MKIELNDETLTAYALGELDATETKAVEKLLADAARAGNDQPRNTLAEIRAAIDATYSAFAESAPDISLSVEQRVSVETSAQSAPYPVRIWSRLAGVAAMAAMIAIVATIAYLRPGVLKEKQGIEIAVQPVPGETAPSVQPAAELVVEESRPVQILVEGAVPIPAVDPLRYESPANATEASQLVAPGQESPSNIQAAVPISGKDDAVLSPVEDAQIAQHGTAETVAVLPQDKPGEAATGQRMALGDSGATTTAEAPQETNPTTTFEWKRRSRPESTEAGKSKPAPKKESGKKSERDVVFAPDIASAAAAPAPAAPAAANAESLPGLSEQLNSIGYSARAGAQLSTTGNGGLSRRVNHGMPEVERLSSRGTAAAVDYKFQTAAIDDRTGWRFRQPGEPAGTEAYAPIAESPFIRVADQPLSTFSIDVDTASYSNMRRYLDQGQLPPPDAVRVEELINYFDYAYPAPTDGRPFAAHFEAAACPWAPAHTLVRIGLKGREVPRAERPATNLVFLIDVSGSMQPENKLPLVKRAMAMLTRQLDERDRVSIVTYASGVNLALPVTNAARQDVILSAIESLGAGGSTNGAGGIQLAYQSARENFLQGGVNRVILATDGDFNVGISDNDSLLALIQQEAKSGVFLSVFGFGMGNLKDDKLEMLADKGNGVYGYIDSESEARKMFVEKLSGTLVTIAKDVKIQVEFNPARVAAYKLIGYENRVLAAQDFNDDRKDAGEIGAGHTVTALYEIVPAGQAIPAAGSVDSLRYQSRGDNPNAIEQTAEELLKQGRYEEAIGHLDALRNQQPELFNEITRRVIELKKAGGLPLSASEQQLAAKPAHADELLLVKLRYKEPEGAVSKLLEFPLTGDAAPVPSADLKFASAVAAFGKMLRGNPAGPALTYDGMMQLAQAGLAASDDPRRAEMIHLMLQARPLIEAQPSDRRYLESIGYVQ